MGYGLWVIDEHHTTYKQENETFILEFKKLIIASSQV
jgi:hypothetical protein